MGKTKEREEDGGEDRRARLLAVAADVFFEEGFEGACIDDVIERAGGSKRTIYNEFGNKEGLFEAMIADLVSRYSNDVVTRLNFDETSGVDVRSALVDHAKRVMTTIYSPRVISLYRTVIGEALRFPRLAKAFYDNGPGRTAVHFARLLQHYREQGEIDVEDCARAAEQFAGLIRDSSYFSVLVGCRKPPTAREIDARANAAVDLFLNGYGTKPRAL